MGALTAIGRFATRSFSPEWGIVVSLGGLPEDESYRISTLPIAPGRRQEIRVRKPLILRQRNIPTVGRARQQGPVLASRKGPESTDGIRVGNPAGARNGDESAFLGRR